MKDFRRVQSDRERELNKGIIQDAHTKIDTIEKMLEKKEGGCNFDFQNIRTLVEAGEKMLQHGSSDMGFGHKIEHITVSLATLVLYDPNITDVFVKIVDSMLKSLIVNPETKFGVDISSCGKPPISGVHLNA